MSQLFQLIQGLHTPFNMVATICLIFAVTSVIASVVKQIRKYVCHRQEIEFKREMLDRGMSAEEIEQVIEATPKEGIDHGMEDWAKKKGK
ncbi:MAG: hypothetical protein IH898_06140 [Planctomycetes bacterium]|nr:hypothetical protein [Planctomycetota bacterium]